MVEKLEAVQRDAITAGEAFDAEIAGHLVRVKGALDWPASNVRAVKEGDFTTWAEKCLIRDGETDYYKVWESIDPTLSQVEQFFNDIKARTGQHPGK